MLAARLLAARLLAACCGCVRSSLGSPTRASHEVDRASTHTHAHPPTHILTHTHTHTHTALELGSPHHKLYEIYTSIVDNKFADGVYVCMCV